MSSTVADFVPCTTQYWAWKVQRCDRMHKVNDTNATNCLRTYEAFIRCHRADACLTHPESINE